MSKSSEVIAAEDKYCAHNYNPLPVVLVKGEGVYLWDMEGKRYLDMMSAYSAVSHGHCHPRLVQCLIKQAQQLNVVSRAFHSDKLGVFLQRACELTGLPRACPMNTGAEAVETALKAARKWAYTVKGVPADRAEIIVCSNNFHGRTISIISMSTEPQYREGFGPLTPGFKIIPYGDSAALEAAITKNTAAFLVEPIQGEAGIVLPPVGYLKEVSHICQKNNVLLLVDEIQTGLGRTGAFLACHHESVIPDGLILGKSLGGGLLPVSLFLSREDVMNVFKPGDHGSTFGGNALAAAVGLEALNVLIEENLSANSAKLGELLLAHLRRLDSPVIKEVRGLGLFVGIEINSQYATAREVVLALMAEGILSKETHETVVRLAPPLIIQEPTLKEAMEIIARVIKKFS